MSVRRILSHAPGTLLLIRARSYSSSSVLLKAKTKQYKDKPEVPSQSPLATPQDKIKLPTSVKHWEALSYEDSMTKLQKKNPEVIFTKDSADSALEKFASLTMPSHTCKMAMRQLEGGPAAKRRTDQAMVRDWKRLQSGSEAYWKESDSCGSME